MQQKNYYKEIIISLVIATAVGIAFNPLIGLVSFFIIGSFLSKGSVPKEEMGEILKSNDATSDTLNDPAYSMVAGNIYNND